MSRDRGQAVLPLVAVVLLVVAAMLGTARLAERAVGSARAQVAADATALAAVQAGYDAAVDVAERHGATLISVVGDGDDVLVDVAVDGQRGQARAGR